MNSCALTTSPFSFETFYKQNLSAVRRLVMRHRFSDAAMDDLVQDIFIQAWRKHEQVREPQAMRSWLLTIARNTCINRRKQERITLSLSTEGVEEQLEVLLMAEDRSADMHFEMALSLLQDLIESQENKERAAIAKAFYIEAMPVKEIAEQWGLKQNTVLSHLRRFRLVAAQALVSLAEEKGCDGEKVLTARRQATYNVSL